MGSPKFNFDCSYEFKPAQIDCGYHAVEIERDPSLWEIIKDCGPEFNIMKARRLLFIDGQIFQINFSLFEMGDNQLKCFLDKIKEKLLNFSKLSMSKTSSFKVCPKRALAG